MSSWGCPHVAVHVAGWESMHLGGIRFPVTLGSPVPSLGCVLSHPGT